jgi:response regulator RpfG family c-di-GMP phosphodiesterase
MIHVLYLDDEEHNLTAFRAAFRRHFEVHVTTDSAVAERLLDEHPIEVVISDQKMPEICGVEFFEMIMANHPDPVRMLLTGHADIDAVIDAINKGRIYKYISKPWNEAELKRLVEEASEIYRARKRSQQVSAAYGKNLMSIREALILMRAECAEEPSPTQETRLRWISALDATIQWIENPDSEFHLP